ncbi:flavin reductase family protein [Shinella sp.]|uniref:flavin reductase family protein n=1 Tax=Shinella sp. TaxID=1870904 RepID=UPI003F708554
MSGPGAHGFDARAFRDACGAFCTGVTVIAAEADGETCGMTANAFMSLSLEPPLIAVAPALKARTLAFIRGTGRFGVSILPQGSDALAWHFAGRPQQGLAPRFELLDGVPILAGAAAAFASGLEREVAGGDHGLLIGRVTALRRDPQSLPLLFHAGRFACLQDSDAAPDAGLERAIWGFGW